MSEELVRTKKILSELGFKLDYDQPHLGGERYLMRAVTTTSGQKLILLGYRTSDNKKVVIKITSDSAGIREIDRERECRQLLEKIGFAYQVFFSPKELLFTKKDGHTIFVQEFIEHERPFLERPLDEQFSIALRAFKAQESAHATTYSHFKLIQKTFGSINAKGYLENFTTMSNHAGARQFLENNRETIEQYCGFLTHTDFVPHNFRVANNIIYLLDHSSLRFGNKYEGWARFLNFMTLYNPALEKVLLQYVRDNRTGEETLSLKLMRVYRLGEIIWYYQDKIPKSSGDLQTLNKARVNFWNQVLEAILEDKPLSDEIRKNYKKLRDSLRSPEEKKRQIGLH